MDTMLKLNETVVAFNHRKPFQKFWAYLQSVTNPTLNFRIIEIATLIEGSYGQVYEESLKILKENNKKTWLSHDTPQSKQTSPIVAVSFLGNLQLVEPGSCINV